MITDALLTLIFGLLELILSVFPTVAFNPVDLLEDAFGYLDDLNYFLPIAELAAVFVTFAIIVPAMLGVTLTVWLVALIRGGSARA